MVDDFQKKYDALQIPFPKDTLSSQIDQQATAAKSKYEQLVKDSKTRIVGINEEKAKWEAMMPVEEMNLEEVLDAGIKGIAVDPQVESMWPHEQSYEEWKATTLQEKIKEDAEAH